MAVERLLQSGVHVDITDWVISKVHEYGLHYITVVSIGILIYIYIERVILSPCTLRAWVRAMM